MGDAAGAVRCRNSACSSVFSSSICLSSNSLMTNRRQDWLARARAANINFRTARSPKACGMILVRRRSSPNSRSSRFVVRMALRWAIGSRRWAMQASSLQGRPRRQATPGRGDGFRLAGAARLRRRHSRLYRCRPLGGHAAGERYRPTVASDGLEHGPGGATGLVGVVADASPRRGVAAAWIRRAVCDGPPRRGDRVADRTGMADRGGC